MTKSKNFLYFSYHIQRIRKEQKLTQREMAGRLGIGVRTLSMIEKGILPPRLSCAIIFRIQDQFGIHPKDLFKPCPVS